MKLTRFAFLATLLLLISSACIEHEIIPPPVNKVDLNASFVGYVNGTQVELTQNVNNYLGFALDTQIVNVAPILSKVIYTSAHCLNVKPAKHFFVFWFTRMGRYWQHHTNASDVQ